MRKTAAIFCSTWVALAALCACGGGGGGPAPVVPLVELRIADPLVHVGSFHPVEVRIDPASGRTLDDFLFQVPAGPLAGDVSLSQERGASGTPTILLLVGPQPGVHDLVVRDAVTEAELDRLSFTTTTRWSDQDSGPSAWFTGTPQLVTLGAAWGGGPTTPQNLGVHPALGTQRIAVVLCDSVSQRYTPEEAAQTRDAYLDNIMRGATDGGVIRSVAAYYNEVSYGKFTVSAEAFGPYALDGVFGDYIIAGNFTQAYASTAIEAADADINYDDFDIVLLVLRTDETTDPARPVAAWPYAGLLGPVSTGEGHKTISIISMSSTFIHPGTIAHEVGHTLHMADMYRPEVPRPPPSMGLRNVDRWGLMHNDRGMPHFMAAHRMRLGWIEGSWVRNIDFSRAAGPVDELVDLEAIERGSPTLAPYNVLEIRIADGWNYYFEHRNPQAGHIGDQDLPRPGSVVGSDAVDGPFPIDRPFLLLLNDDEDGDGSVLQAGENYRETDLSDPTFPTDFQLDVEGIAAQVATVRVRYGVHSKPDPSIRPWPAGPEAPYQSPDIEIRNARNAADPSLINIPWAQNPNTIVARVTNRGNLNAQDVRVNFYVKGLTTGGAAEVFLGSDTQSIGPGATVEFTAPWTPPREEHYCIVVRIPLYVTPVGGTVEMTELNNMAQSNYARFISATASPASRERTFLIVGNPFPKRTRVTLVSAQTNPYYRTYIEHRSVVLDPGELRRVNVMFEHAGKFPDLGEPGGSAGPIDPNRVIIKAYVTDPRSAPVESELPFDGVQIRVDTGRATQVELLADDKGDVTGTVRTLDDTEEVAGGQVIVSHELATSAGRIGHQLVKMVDGSFTAKIPPEWTAVHATYLPIPSLAESDASRIR